MEVFSSEVKASHWLKQGNILIHPTEGVWGIGCDAFNRKAVKRIYEIKKRALNKSLIIVCNNIDIMQDYLIPYDPNDVEEILKNTKDPVTILYPYSKEKLPEHLQNDTGKLAIRVSAHYPLKSLLEEFNNSIVSTSANISSQETLQDIEAIKETFPHKDVALFNKELGSLNKSTPIIDLISKEVLRQ